MIEADIVAAIARRLTRELAPPATPLRRFRVGTEVVGALSPERARRLARFGEVFSADGDSPVLRETLRSEGERTAALAAVTRVLAAEAELSGWRDENYAVASSFGGAPLFLLERAAARYFGVMTYAVHVNGLVRGRDDGAALMWLARRSPTKAIDPSRLDNLVGGGIAAGLSVAATLVKESREEAGIPATQARAAASSGAVHVHRAEADGLQRETIFVHDLWLPPGFAPSPEDGEVVEHRLVPLVEAARLITLAEGPDVVTAEASLVIVDCLMRLGTIGADTPGFLALDALRHTPLAIASPR